MKLIVGLGNPGRRHENNRHNVGYMVIDKLKAQKAKVKSAVFTKTNVFMNESGEAVKRLVTRYLVTSNSKKTSHEPASYESLFIVHDDLDIPLGGFKIQFGRGPKVHKGVDSVEQELGTAEFWRVRIGVDNRNPENRTPGDEYVLEDFLPEEKKVISGVIEKVVAQLVKS